MGGRPRTPTAILEARGAFKKDPQRKRDDEPEVKDPLGNPPEHLQTGERDIWLELAAQAPLGVLTVADRVALEMASTLLYDYRRSRNIMPALEELLSSDNLSDETARDLVYELKRIRSSYPAALYSQLNKLLSHFGMTPSDRAKLSIPKAKRANAFADD